MLLSVSAMIICPPLNADEGFSGVELPGEAPEGPATEAEMSPQPPAGEAAPETSEAAPEHPVVEPPSAPPPAAESEFLGVVLPPEAYYPPQPPPAEAASPASAPRPEAQSMGEPEPPRVPPKEAQQPKPIFPWFTVSPQIGYLFFPKSEMEFNGMKATVETRNGLTAKLHFDLGGDGLGFEIAPLYAMEFGGIHPGVNLSGLDFSKDAAGASIQVVGGELTIVYRFAVKRFYPHIGAGFRGTYLFGDEVMYGTEIYGRFPIGFSVYVGRHVALLFEVGLMAGATGVRTPPALPEAFDTMDPSLRGGLEHADTRADFESWYADNQYEIDLWMAEHQDELPEGYDRNQMATDFVSEQMGRSIRFGSGFGMDVVFGVRFP